MRRNTYLINIAMFMIFLVVTLPIYSADAMAASIDSVVVQGGQGIPHFRGQTDTTVINVTATVPDDPILEPTQVRLVEDPGATFNCTPSEEIAGRFECIKEYPEVSLSKGGIFSFTVRLFSDAQAPLAAPKSGSVVVDNLPPKLMSPVDYTAHENGVVTAAFDIKDESCDKSACNNICVGMSSIRFTVAGLPVGQNNSFPSGCEFDGEVNLTGLVVAGEVESKRVCIEMTDLLGQSSTECTDVNVDARPPVVSGIRIVDLTGKNVIYTNGETIGNVLLEFNISEDGDLLDVFVNASGLSERPEHEPIFGNMTAQCTGSTPYICTVGPIFVVMSSPKTISARIYAKDDNGNRLDEITPVPMTFDSTRPVVTKIYSSYVDDKGNYWVAEENNRITASIVEADSGMAYRKLFLDFASFGAQPIEGGSVAGVMHPNSCVPDWNCFWDWVGTDKSSGTSLYLRPMAGSMDDAKNLFAVPVPHGNFKVDRDPPEIDAALLAHSNMTGLGESGQMTNLSSGDMLEITLFVKDHSGISKAVANLSHVIENGEWAEEGVCTENHIDPAEMDQRIFECKWSPSEPLMRGYLSGLKIPFTFYDYTNHSYTYTWSNIEILEKENVSATRWMIAVDSFSPSSGIDRLSWGIGNHRMYYRLNMYSYGGVLGVTSINLDPMDCVGLDWVNQDTVTSEFEVGLMGFGDFRSGSTQDIFVIALNPGSVPEYYMIDGSGGNVSVDEVYVNCTFYMQSIVTSTTGKALTLPEGVNVSFPIPVYNNPLGQNIGNINDEIAQLEKDVDQTIDDVVHYTNMILAYAREMCRFIEMYMSLMTMWAGLKEIFTTVCNAKVVGPGGCKASQTAGQTTAALADATKDMMGELYFMCGLFISCRLTKNAKKAMVANCPKKTGWCTVKKTWAKWNGFWAEYINLAAANRALSKSLGMTVTVEERKGMEDVTEGLTIFSVDDFDPTRSIITSAGSACLPGILMNIEKYRQIKCKKLLCLKIDAAQGRPKWQCDKQYDYEMCTWATGQIFAALPITQYIEQIGLVLNRIVKQPASFVLGLVMDKGCTLGICGNPAFWGCKACMVAMYALSLAALVTDLVENTADRFKDISFDYCEEALKDDPSYANLGFATDMDETEAESEAASATTTETTPETPTT
ncbi:hypothetical protein ACFL3V_00515 [Nanoarchaeota archaeon]